MVYVSVMTAYTAEDGLNILTYVGITRITEQERAVFRKEWGKCHRGKDQDVVSTTWTLYAEVLPFTCRDDERGAFLLAQLRDIDFGKRLEATGLDEDLKKGMPLEEILKTGPHTFVRAVDLD